jgi:SulP family sulfate permease
VLPGPTSRRSAANQVPTAATATSRHPDNELPSHVAVLRIESSLYFANADAVRTRVMHAAERDSITAVILDAETIPFIDVTATRMLAALAEDLDRRDVRLLLARDIGQVRDILHSVIENPTITHFYPTVQTAVAAAQKRT